MPATSITTPMSTSALPTSWEAIGAIVYQAVSVWVQGDAAEIWLTSS